jgi:hypothetical protein
MGYTNGMNKLTFGRFYNDLTRDEQTALARDAGTSLNHLYQVATDRRKAGMHLSSRLKAADNRITDSMLRPDLYS